MKKRLFLQSAWRLRCLLGSGERAPKPADKIKAVASF